jgi:hypothetical protein
MSLRFPVRFLLKYSEMIGEKQAQKKISVNQNVFLCSVLLTSLIMHMYTNLWLRARSLSIGRDATTWGCCFRLGLFAGLGLRTLFIWLILDRKNLCTAKERAIRSTRLPQHWLACRPGGRFSCEQGLACVLAATISAILSWRLPVSSAKALSCQTRCLVGTLVPDDLP